MYFTANEITSYMFRRLLEWSYYALLYISLRGTLNIVLPFLCCLMCELIVVNQKKKTENVFLPVFYIEFHIQSLNLVYVTVSLQVYI